MGGVTRASLRNPPHTAAWWVLRSVLMRHRFLISVFLVLSSVEPVVGESPCEVDRPVAFADLNWESNAIHAAVAGYIVRQGYGCEVRHVPGSTLPLLVAMSTGEVDITMEVWKDNILEVWEAAETAGRVKDLGINFADAVQGWFIPRYLQQGDPARGIKALAPDLKHVKDLPRYKTLFKDPEQPHKGRFYNCILGWGCEVINTNKLRAYGLTEHYTNYRPGSGEALVEAITSSYEEGDPVLAYYWGPSWVLGKLDLVMLEEPAYDPAKWEELARTNGQSEATAYPRAEVRIGVNAEFAKTAPRIEQFLKRYGTSGAIVSSVLAYLHDHQGITSEEIARYFLQENERIWTLWVPEDVAQRVRASLQ